VLARTWSGRRESNAPEAHKPASGGPHWSLELVKPLAPLPALKESLPFSCGCVVGELFRIQQAEAPQDLPGSRATSTVLPQTPRQIVCNPDISLAFATALQNI